MFTRTVNQLGEVAFMVKNCGNMFVMLPWGMVGQGLVLVVMKIASRVTISATNVVKEVLEEIKKK